MEMLMWEIWQMFSQMDSPPESGDIQINLITAGIWERVIYRNLLKTEHCYPQMFIDSVARASALCVISHVRNWMLQEAFIAYVAVVIAQVLGEVESVPSWMRQNTTFNSDLSTNENLQINSGAVLQR